MAFGKNARVLTYDNYVGLETEELPDWIRTAAEDAETTDQYDASWDFGRSMTEAGAKCVETYGFVEESIDVWRLPEGEGWLVMHFDGDDCDLFFYFPAHEAKAYADFQSFWVASMARKIIASDRYMKWRADLENERASESRVH